MTAAWNFVCAVEAVGKTPEGPHFQRTLMHRITQKLLQTVGEKRPGVVECPAELGLPPYLPTATVPVRFQIGDWAFVTAVERMVRNGALQAGLVQLWEENGFVTSGIQGTHNGRPVMTITAAREIETLFVRIGAFDRRLEFRGHA
ncbi:MAG: hypothetical protein NVV83_08280 [Afipia sp.]|nr:hypothetical protein [Afipia sp.]